MLSSEELDNRYSVENLTNYSTKENDIYHHHRHHLDDAGGGGGGNREDESWTMIMYITDMSDFILFALSMPSLFANGFVLWASRRLSKKTGDPTHMLVASMTVADVLLCTTQDLRIIMHHFANTIPPPFVVATHMLAAWTGCSACGMSLLLLNVEKMLYFHWPLHYDRLVTPCKTLIGAAILWTLCLAYSILMYALSIHQCDNDFCIVPPSEMFMIYVIAFCLVPVLSSGVLSVYLWCTVRSKRQRSVTNNPSAGSQPKIPVCAQLKTVLFIFTTSIWVLVSWVPARLHYIFFIESTNSFISWFGWCANYLLLLSPVLNPFLTVFVYPCYRKLAQKCAKCSALRRRYQHVDTSIGTTQLNGCTYSPNYDRHLVYCPKDSLSIEESNF